jgi:hypothetical protein
MNDARPVQFSLRRMMVWVLIASILLFAGTWIVRRLNAPPRGFESDHPQRGTAEIMDVTHALGPDELKDLRVWVLAGQIFPEDYAWRGKASRRAVDRLKKIARMQSVSESQVPAEFWKMPPRISTMPDWWQPHATETAEYYMTPEFPSHSYKNGDLNCCVVYEPEDGAIYVMSQFNF